MELRHLRYFVAVAETLNFRQAAANLNMAQPPLSYQIKQLEQELNVLLFDRNRRQVKLTTAGQQFLVDAKALLAKAENAKLSAQRIGLGELGFLHIGFVGSVAYQLLPAILKDFAKKFPDVKIKLSEMTTATQVAALNEHAIDVGLLRPPVNSAELQTDLIAKEPMVAVLPATHELAQKTSIKLADLAQEAFICFPRVLGSGAYDVIISACQAAGFSPNIIQEAVQMSTIVGLVSAEIGVALVPESVAVFCHPDVKFVPLKQQTHQFEVALIWHPAFLSQIAQNFVQGVKRT